MADDEKTTIGPNKYQCEICGGVFDNAWTDEEARIELDTIFPGHTRDNCYIVCDDCYNQLFNDNPDIIDMC